jgi:hypothetical protein
MSYPESTVMQAQDIVAVGDSLPSFVKFADDGGI